MAIASEMAVNSVDNNAEVSFVDVNQQSPGAAMRKYIESDSIRDPGRSNPIV